VLVRSNSESRLVDNNEDITDDRTRSRRSRVFVGSGNASGREPHFDNSVSARAITRNRSGQLQSGSKKIFVASVATFAPKLEPESADGEFSFLPFK